MLRLLAGAAHGDGLVMGMSTPHTCEGAGGLGLGVRVVVSAGAGRERYTVEACCFAEARRRYTILLEDDKRRWEADHRELEPSIGQQSDTPDCFAALGLRGDATLSDVKRAYRRLVLKVHPDHGGDAATFRQLQADYEACLAYLAEQSQEQAA